MHSTRKRERMRKKITATFIFEDDTKMIIKDVESKESLMDWLKYINYKNDERINAVLEALENSIWVDIVSDNFTSDFSLNIVM